MSLRRWLFTINICWNTFTFSDCLPSASTLLAHLNCKHMGAIQLARHHRHDTGTKSDTDNNTFP